MKEIEDFIDHAASMRGILPDYAANVADSEGGRNEYAVLAKFPTGWSWWPYQLHYGGAEYPQYGTEAGMGNDFTRISHWAPGDPRAWRDSVRYALNVAKRDGWGNWFGARRIGIGIWDGIDRDHPWDSQAANAESWDFEQHAPSPIPEPPVITSWVVNDDAVRLRQRAGLQGDIITRLNHGTKVVPISDETVMLDGHVWRHVAIGGPVGWIAEAFLSPEEAHPVGLQGLHFDPNTPTEIQRQNWTCSIRSTMWMLKSIGIDVTPEFAQDTMSPQYVNEEVGLRDGSGAGIVEVLRNVWGVVAENRASVSFDELTTWAGEYPVAMGGHGWGHWVGLRGYDGTSLLLANPGGTSGYYGHQSLDRALFSQLGPWSAVIVRGKVA